MHGVDEFRRPSNEPVETFWVIGDTSGNDIGQEEGDTGVTVDFRDISVELIQAQDCAGAQVEVQFIQIDIHHIDERACAVRYVFTVGHQETVWQTSTFVAPGSNNVSKNFLVILLENEDLNFAAQGLYAINCQAPVSFGGNLGNVQRVFSAASDWGTGVYAERITNPFDITLHYRINADWLP